MACGICGGAGHNRRTCGGGASGGGSSSYSTNYYGGSGGYSSGYSYNYSPPAVRRTVTCGTCGQQGHNSRTCSSGSYSQNTSYYTSSSSNTSGYGSLFSLYTSPPAPSRTVTCGTCGQQGHNSRTCTSGSSSQESTRTVTCGTCGQQGHNSRTCTSGPSSRESTRTVTCGVCGQQGHNSRTCTSGPSSRNSDGHASSSRSSSLSGFGLVHSKDSENASPSATRTVTCGTCGQQGHNSRTCTSGSSGQVTITTTAVKSGTCGQSGHNSKTCTVTSSVGGTRNYSTYNRSGALEKEDSVPLAKKTVKCGNCGQPGHNIRTCDDSCKTSHADNPKQKTCGNCGEKGHNTLTCKTSGARPDSKNETPYLSTTQKKRSCVICGENDHTYDTCKHGYDLSELLSKARETIEKRDAKKKSSESGKVENKAVEKPKVNVILKQDSPKKLNVGKFQLTPEAKAKLDMAPTDQDDKGYIYMYREANPSKGERNHYKIGMTKNQPELRIRVQERNNDEDYEPVFTRPTNNRKLTEAVIHAQLKDCHDPKEEGDGKSEWFRGNREEFINVIERCQKIVDRKYE